MILLMLSFWLMGCPPEGGNGSGGEGFGVPRLHLAGPREVKGHLGFLNHFGKP